MRKPHDSGDFERRRQPHDDPEEIRALLVRQVVSPVRWEDSMRYLLGQGYDQFYEVGPGPTLRGLLKRIDRKVACEGVECLSEGRY